MTVPTKLRSIYPVRRRDTARRVLRGIADLLAPWPRHWNRHQAMYNLGMLVATIVLAVWTMSSIAVVLIAARTLWILRVQFHTPWWQIALSILIVIYGGVISARVWLLLDGVIKRSMIERYMPPSR